MPRKRWSASLLALLAAFVACAHEVVRLSEDPPSLEPPTAPIPLTVAVVVGSFDRTRLNADGVTALFAEELREAGIFQGVMSPVPPGASPRWEIQLAGSDSALEPNSNYWKSALTAALPPFALFVSLQNDYTLELEALLLDRRELIKSYTGKASIRHRYKRYANRVQMDVEGVEVVVRATTRRILAALAQDAAEIEGRNARDG
jgi:hypothetical protein